MEAIALVRGLLHRNTGISSPYPPAMSVSLPGYRCPSRMYRQSHYQNIVALPACSLSHYRRFTTRLSWLHARLSPLRYQTIFASLPDYRRFNHGFTTRLSSLPDYHGFTPNYRRFATRALPACTVNLTTRLSSPFPRVHYHTIVAPLPDYHGFTPYYRGFATRLSWLHYQTIFATRPSSLHYQTIFATRLS